MKQFHAGIRLFQQGAFLQLREKYENVANAQAPRALFITCSDSRVDPELITQSGPGELFVERNPGNIAPPFTEERIGVYASVEYAIAVLHVPEIVVCGHSNCGAIQGICYPEKVAAYPSVARWLTWGQPARERLAREYPELTGEEQLRQLTRLNVLAQIENLRSYPIVREKLEAKLLTLSGCVFEIHTGKVEELELPAAPRAGH